MVAQIERGVIKNPTGSTIVAIAKALDMDPGELLTGDMHDAPPNPLPRP